MGGGEKKLTTIQAAYNIFNTIEKLSPCKPNRSDSTKVCEDVYIKELHKIIKRYPNITTHNSLHNTSKTTQFEHVLLVGWMERKNKFRCVVDNQVPTICFKSLYPQ